ncbi:uncharacterized protein LOC131857320 [Cryptomeria japonica]|uniref:uncharacterized protein LOC131857320 n=1 Tax=Cryptomeria japonica TaxID=3369 RepID=UPI0027DAA532|nr:uncharacterized protein LOC131857320 [Cryptomeria japonica]
MELIDCKMLKVISALSGMVNLETLSIDNYGDKVQFEIIETADQPSMPAISFEHMERLQTLQLLVECNISAIEICIQTIKKWPSASMILGRTERGVESVMKSSAFPGLTLVDSGVVESGHLTLKCGQRHRSNSAAMVCFHINCTNSVYLSTQNFDPSIDMVVGEGKWVWLGVFTQPSLTTEEYTLEGSECDSGRGMVVMGEQQRVVEAFKKLLLFFG